MSKVYVVCVWDKKAGLYHEPRFTNSVGAFMRGFVDEVNRSAEDNVMYAHPEDFELMRLGEFDNETGLFATGVPQSLVKGEDVKK